MVTKEKTAYRKMAATLAALLLVSLSLVLYYASDPWGFYWKVSDKEAAVRMDYVRTAQNYFGCREADGSHRDIIDIYNSHEPLAAGYTVQYTDSWCAVFVSTAAIESSITDILPTECGCERQIGLWQALHRWEERDSYIPLPGDLIYYDWDETKPGECTGWSDHVGMVVGTKWPFLKVIEGNKDDCVTYRVIRLNDPQIRGFGLPDYASKTK